MEYYAAHKIPEVVAFRGKVSALRKTYEMQAMQKHWAEVTQQKQHQVVAYHSVDLIMAAAKTLHMTKKDAEWMSPQKSPVMFDVWHAVYVYFVAMGRGDLNPMLDFIIDGKYDEEFVEANNNPSF